MADNIRDRKKIDRRRRMHACLRDAKMIEAAASVYKSSIGIPHWMVPIMATAAMAVAADAANRIPVKVFKCDLPEIDRRRSKRLFRRLGGGVKRDNFVNRWKR